MTVTPGPRRHGPSSPDCLRRWTAHPGWRRQKSCRRRVWMGRRWGGRTSSQSQHGRGCLSRPPPPRCAARVPSRPSGGTDAGRQWPSAPGPGRRRPRRRQDSQRPPAGSPSELHSALVGASGWKVWGSRWGAPWTEELLGTLQSGSDPGCVWMERSEK